MEEPLLEDQPRLHRRPVEGPPIELLLDDEAVPHVEEHRPHHHACEIAGIDPLGFHQIWHTYASLYLMSGGSLVALAKQLGHTTTRMVEKHYGHLADSWRAEEARKHAPSLGLGDRKVVRLKRRRT